MRLSPRQCRCHQESGRPRLTAEQLARGQAQGGAAHDVAGGPGETLSGRGLWERGRDGCQVLPRSAGRWRREPTSAKKSLEGPRRSRQVGKWKHGLRKLRSSTVPGHPRRRRERGLSVSQEITASNFPRTEKAPTCRLKSPACGKLGEPTQARGGTQGRDGPANGHQQPAE